MTPERWRRIKEILDVALASPVAEQQALLDQVCVEDRDLEREVASLAALEGRLGGFLERPARMVTRDSAGGEKRDDAARCREAGHRVGSYEILRRLSHGGMGMVYLAQREGDDRNKVALKVIRREIKTPKLIDRFRYEQQILARLEHPNVVRLLDNGTTGGGRPYLVMEYVVGQPIDRYCDSRGLSLRARIELFRRVCRTVRYLHRNLVIHLDLKPSNMLVTAKGEPKILDFGIAEKRSDPDLRRPPRKRSSHLSASSVALTPNYASPEQIRGDAVTASSDVYSLGVLLCRLLTGSLPYRFDVDRAGAMARRTGKMESPNPCAAGNRPGGDPHPSLRCRLEGDLGSIVMRAMAIDPARRHESVDQLSEDLRRYLEYLPTAREGSFPAGPES